MQFKVFVEIEGKDRVEFLKISAHTGKKLTCLYKEALAEYVQNHKVVVVGNQIPS